MNRSPKLVCPSCQTSDDLYSANQFQDDCTCFNCGWSGKTKNLTTHKEYQRQQRQTKLTRILR